MSAPLTIIQLRAPALATSPGVESLITQADAETTEGYPTTDLRDKAIALLVCHWLTLSKRDAASTGTTGILIGEKEGGLERTYAAPSSSGKNGIDPDLGQTRWGVELYNFQRKYLITIRNRFI